MNQLTKKILLAACSVAGLLTLSACGGSDDPAPPGLAQTITFISPGNQNLLQAPPALVANATSGLPVVFASTTPSVCTVSGTTLTLVSVGSCTVGAAQLGDATYAPAPLVSNTFTVSILLTAQTITFASPGNQTVGIAPAPLVATSTSGLTVAFASTTPGVCTVSGTRLTLLAAGPCTVVASQAGNGTYAAAAIVPQSFTVAVGAQTINFTSPGNQILGTAPAPLSATSTSGLVVSFASTTPSVCTVSGTTLTLLSAGTCTVAADQAGDANYAAAPQVLNSFTVAKTPQTITFISPGSQVLGSVPAALTATASSGLAVSFASTTPAVCTVSGTTLMLVTVGTCTVSASQAGNASYAAAAPVSNSFAVAASLTAQTITFTSPGNQTLGTTPGALVATSTSGLPVAFASTTPGVCTVSGTTLKLVAVGNCTVAASQAGNGTYAAATPVSNTFAVAATPQTITFVSPGNKTLGTAPFALVATASSNLPVAFASTTAGVCTVSGTTLTLVAAGQCTVNANQAGNATYAAAPTVPQTFTVSAVVLTSQTISFTSPANVTVGTPVTLGATATSGLPVTYTSGTLPVCTVSGSTLTPVAAGNCTITASQAGNGTFAAATPVPNTFAVAAVATINGIANGGFEVGPNGAGEFADGWQQTTSKTTRTNAQAHSGTWSALLAIPDDGTQGNGTGLFQNSVENGFLLPISQANWGTAPTLTFWIKGNTSETGNLNYALRYLDAVGNILNQGSKGAVTIWTGNTDRPWTQYTRTPNTVIPNGTTAIFLEITLATGPTGTFPGCGPVGSFCNWGTANIYIDDVNLQVLP